MGPLTKVIPLKLFLDIVPSSSADITRAIRGQPNGLSRNYLKQMAGRSFYMFWFRFIPEMFSALSAAFLCGQAFVCFSAGLAVHYFAVYSVLAGKLN